ncbi:hypothetical protein CKA32_002428 [Geitlerinema sp. FC II]|nr:hypothetical protein CKA32_002428 [Geitlerinema sp. FC II]
MSKNQTPITAKFTALEICSLRVEQLTEFSLSNLVDRSMSTITETRVRRSRPLQ